MYWAYIRQTVEAMDLGGYDPGRVAELTGVTAAVAARFVDPMRTFWVTSVPEYGWLAGADARDAPTLLFVGAPRLAGTRDLGPAPVRPLNAVTFNVDIRPVEDEAGNRDVVLSRPDGLGSHPLIETRGIACGGELSWDAALEAAEAAIGFQHIGQCPALAFKHPEHWYYALVPFRVSDHRFIASGEGADQAPETRWWITEGMAALHCGNEYWLSADGTVHSS